MKQYQIKISDRFAALENLNDTEDINRAWDIKTSAKEGLGLYELSSISYGLMKNVYNF